MKNLSRRDALKRTVMFSTALLTPGWLQNIQGQSPATQFTDEGMHLLAVGDFGTKDPSQIAVARQMEAFAAKLKGKLTGVLALGDNFYGNFTEDRFQKHFEEMYSKEALACPFYFCLGNHDYEPVGYGEEPRLLKWQTQLDYAAQNPASRWKIPARWYTLELPDAVNPLVKIIVLDSNFNPGEQTPQSKLDQDRFLQEELEKGSKAPWLWVMAHNPLFTQSHRKDNKVVISRLGPYLQKYPVSLYLAGHCHTLQHIEIPGYHSSFVVSGGGGAHLHEVRPAERAYARSSLGFNHIHVTRDRMEVQFIDVDGNRMYAFGRTLDGKVEIITPASPMAVTPESAV